MLAGCDRAGLGAAVTLAQRVRGWVDAVDVAIARRSRELAAEGRSESAAQVLTGYGRRSTAETKKAASDRVPGRCASRCPASKQRWRPVMCRPAMSMPSPTHPRGWMMPVGRGRRVAGPQVGSGLEPVSVFERRCRLLGKRLAGDEGESELDKQKAAVSMRRWVDKASGIHHSHLALDPERAAKLWSTIDAQLA